MPIMRGLPQTPLRHGTTDGERTLACHGQLTVLALLPDVDSPIVSLCATGKLPSRITTMPQAGAGRWIRRAAHVVAPFPKLSGPDASGGGTLSL